MPNKMPDWANAHIDFCRLANAMEIKDYLTLGIAVVALIISLVTVVLKRPENRRAIRSQLTDVCSKLNTVEAESRKLHLEKMTGRPNPATAGMFSFFNDQRLFLAGQAIYLANQIPTYVTSTEYSLIARAMAMAGDEVYGDAYWQKALNSANGVALSGNLWRGYAGFLFSYGRFDEARLANSKSIKIHDAIGSRRNFVVGESYLRWSASERECGFHDNADELLAIAHQHFGEVELPRLRDHGLELFYDERKRVASLKASVISDATTQLASSGSDACLREIFNKLSIKPK